MGARKKTSVVNTNLEVPDGWGEPATVTPTTAEPVTLSGGLTGDEIFATRDNPLPAPSTGELIYGVTYAGKLWDGRGFRCIWTTSNTGYCGSLPWRGCRVVRDEAGVWRTL